MRVLERQSRAGIGVSVALGRREAVPESPFANILLQLRELGSPATDADRAALGEIAVLVEALLTSESDPDRRSRARPPAVPLSTAAPDSQGV